MTYRAQAQYYDVFDETIIRITQKDPYRDLHAHIRGNVENEPEEILVELAKADLAKEFNPSYAFKEIEKKIEEQDKAQKAILETIVLSKDLNEDQKKNILNQYDEWEIGVGYKAGQKVKHNGKVFEVVQSHTSQADWTPDSTPALFKEYLNTEIKHDDGTTTEVVSEFKQPLGAHDAYKQGDKVSFNGKVYKSKNDGNVHSPEAYPQGWELVEEKEEGQEGKEEGQE